MNAAELSLVEGPLNPNDVKMMRARLTRRPFVPFTVFCGEQQLRQVLHDSRFSFERVKSFGKQIRQGLWAFTIDQRSENNLVQITSFPQHPGTFRKKPLNP